MNIGKQKIIVINVILAFILSIILPLFELNIFVKYVLSAYFPCSCALLGGMIGRKIGIQKSSASKIVNLTALGVIIVAGLVILAEYILQINYNVMVWSSITIFFIGGIICIFLFVKKR
jgi:hypothetical protein